MTATVDTTDVRESRTYKINAYVYSDLATYFEKLTSDNSHTIIAQLGLILKSHEEANKNGEVLGRSKKLATAPHAIERKADVIKIAAAQPPQNSTNVRQAGKIMTPVEVAREWV